MLGQYRHILRRPGAARFSAAGLLARMQLSMAPLGSIMLLSAERNSFAVAGAGAAISAVSTAVISPQTSRLIDIYGQRRIVLLQIAVHLPSMAALISVAVFTRLDWPIFGLAAIAGAAQPNVGPLIRTRWAALLSGTPQLRTAYAYESLIDEVVFILGPPLATVVSLQLFPSAALILATTLLTVGTLLLLTQRSTEPAPSGITTTQDGRPRAAIMLPGVRGIAVIYILLGGVFGSFHVATVAFAKQSGNAAITGYLLALYALGSLLAGLVFGAVRFNASLLRQFTTSVCLLAVVTLPLPFLGSVWMVGAGLAVAGVACSPALISGTSLLEHQVPGHRLTEAISWIGSGLAVGIAIATALAGIAIDNHGPSSGYWVTAGCAVAAAAIAVLELTSGCARADSSDRRNT